MHIILVDDTDTAVAFERNMNQSGLPVTGMDPASLPHDQILDGHCVLLRSGDTERLAENIEFLRGLHGDAILIVVLAASVQTFSNALTLYHFGADAVLAPACDPDAIRCVLEHLAFLATFHRRDANGQRTLRREPDLVGPLLGSVQAHLQAAALLFDRFRMRVTTQSGALYELAVDSGSPTGAQRIDTPSPACSVDELLQLDAGCFLVEADPADALLDVRPELAVVA